MRAALLLLLAGCGGAAGGLSPTFPDNRAQDVGAVLGRLASAPAPDAPVAVAATESALYALELPSGRQLWSVPATVRSGPYLAGELVVTHEDGRAVGRSLRSGAVALSVPDERMELVGAAGEGALSAISLSTTGAVGAQSVVLLARGGSVFHALRMDSPAGAPACRGGMVFLPWGNQNLSVLDGESGDEIARVRLTAGVVGHARAEGRQIVFGQAGVAHLIQSAADGSAEGVRWWQPTVTDLPGRPAPWPNAYEPPPAPRSALHRVRLITASTPEGIVQDTVYLLYYRHVFALASRDLAVRWAYVHDADVVGAAPTSGGLALADEQGRIAWLDPQGAAHPLASAPAQPVVVALRVDGLDTPAPGTAAPVADGLLRAALSTDARLVPARALAVRALAAQAGPAITEHLLVLCDEPSLPAELRRTACEAIGQREDGQESLLRALGRHAGFLEGTSPPPVGALASASARARDRRAVPHLIAHLRDPATQAADLAAIAAALGALGDESAIRPLQDFLRLYHCEADDEALARALAAAAEALIALAGPLGRELVQELIGDGFTMAAARPLLSQAGSPRR